MTSALHSTNEIIETELSDRIVTIEAALDADFVTYSGPISDSAQLLLKAIVESIDPRRRRLAVHLETPGGYIESAERIANTLRHHYADLGFIVTSFAMSAGTVLVMAGDNIYMDYSATLGPIDPQVQRGAGGFVPALGYLEQYERLIAKDASGRLTTAELAYLIQKFDPGELYQYEQARDLSIALLEEWLVKYKFKNWTITATRGKPVTAAMRKKRAKEIAHALNDTRRWHSHSRGISMEVLRRDLKLHVEDLGHTPDLEASIAEYNMLLYDYRGKRGHDSMVANWRKGYHGF